MKKDLIFAPILLVVGILLCLLKLTGMPAHIAISVIGLVVLIVYSVLTKKEWQIAPLEIAMRVSYAIALISGIVIKISYIFVVATLHKVFAILFVVLLVALLIIKIVKKCKK